MDRLHIEGPFASAHMWRDLLPQDGLEVGHKRVVTLMRRMYLNLSLYRKSNTNRRHLRHPV